MLIREVADNKPLQAPAAKWQSHPKVGVLYPASTATSLMWTARSLLPACQDSKTGSKVKCPRPLLPVFRSYCKPPRPHPSSCCLRRAEQGEETDAEAFDSVEETVDIINLLDK